MKILFYSRSYENVAGGIEKMTLDLAVGLKEKGHNVTIVSLDRVGAKSFFNWPKDVQWVQLGIGNIETKNRLYVRIRRLVAIRQVVAFGSFDVAVGFQIGSFALLKASLIGLKIRVVAAERNAPTLFRYIERGALKKLFSNFILLFATKIAIQFEDYRKLYPFWLRRKIGITPNWVLTNHPIKATYNKSVHNILFIGRLTFQKNLEVLLKAFSILPSNFRLTVVGDGPEINDLKNYLSINKIRGVKFLSPLIVLQPIYLDADIFCLPSRWEGFPNVLAEALSYGVPCVGFENCAGINQLIMDGTNGYTAKGIDSAESLAYAILQVSKHNFIPELIASTVKSYTYANYVNLWENILS